MFDNCSSQIRCGDLATTKLRITAFLPRRNVLKVFIKRLTHKNLNLFLGDLRHSVTNIHMRNAM